ncbi:MAG: hypothetical protein MOB07_23245 [Acidobacteria bacterium]|nr:hypothetical protein [Acidobacteriota bacterium]
MASEVVIRASIVDVIKTALVSIVPAPVVLGRDILNVTETGWMNVLRDDNGLGIIHGWTVTQNGQRLLEKRIGAALYELFFDVWQWDQYRGGSDASNSENQSSTERDLVLNAFKWSGTLPTVLQDADPLNFDPGSISTVETDFRGQVRVAKGVLRVETLIGC